MEGGTRRSVKELQVLWVRVLVRGQVRVEVRVEVRVQVRAQVRVQVRVQVRAQASTQVRGHRSKSAFAEFLQGHFSGRFSGVS